MSGTGRNFRLSEPLPLVVDVAGEIRLILGFALAAGIIVAISSPFGLPRFDPRALATFLLPLVVGGILLGLVNRLLLPHLLPKLFDVERWTVGREVVWSCWHLLGFASLVFILAHRAGWAQWSVIDFLQYLAITLVVGGLSLLAKTYIRWNRLLRTHLELLQRSEPVEPPLTPADQVVVGEGDERLTLTPRSYLAARADGNYVTVFLTAEGTVTEHLLRITMKQLEDQLEPLGGLRTHRSWIVNRFRVVDIAGNARGYQLTMDTDSHQVPVSRTHGSTAIPALKTAAANPPSGG